MKCVQLIWKSGREEEKRCVSALSSQASTVGLGKHLLGSMGQEDRIDDFLMSLPDYVSDCVCAQSPLPQSDPSPAGERKAQM